MRAPHAVKVLEGTPIETLGQCISHLLTSHFGFHLSQLSSCRPRGGAWEAVLSGEADSPKAAARRNLDGCKSASNVIRSCGATGFTRWWSNPASARLAAILLLTPTGEGDDDHVAAPRTVRECVAQTS